MPSRIRFILEGKDLNIKKTLMSRPERFTEDESLSPAEKARRRWDEREGDVIAQNYNLRKLIVSLLVIVVVLVGTIAYLATKSSVQPFVVMANPENGEVWHVGTVEAARNFEATEPLKKYFIASFIKNVREVPLDPIVYKNNLKEGFSFMTSQAASKLTAQLENEGAGSKVGRMTATVSIVSILPMDGGKSFQARWTEEEFDIGSSQKTVTPYSGVFTCQTIESNDEAQISANPIGFYISDFNWSKDATAYTKQQGQQRQQGQAAQPAAANAGQQNAGARSR